jgi:hypothetical protein
LKQNPYKDKLSILLNSSFDITTSLLPSVVLLSCHELTEYFIIAFALAIIALQMTSKEKILNPFEHK